MQVTGLSTEEQARTENGCWRTHKSCVCLSRGRASDTSEDHSGALQKVRASLVERGPMIRARFRYFLTLARSKSCTCRCASLPCTEPVIHRHIPLLPASLLPTSAGLRPVIEPSQGAAMIALWHSDRRHWHAVLWSVSSHTRPRYVPSL